MNVEIFDLPVISKKNRLRFGKKKAYKPADVSGFERDLFDAIQSQWRGDMFLENVSVQIEITLPDKRRRDLQNFSDTICDTMNGLVYKDDSQITHLQMRKKFGNRWCLKINVEVDTPPPEIFNGIFPGLSPCRLN